MTNLIKTMAAFDAFFGAPFSGLMETRTVNTVEEFDAALAEAAGHDYQIGAATIRGEHWPVRLTFIPASAFTSPSP